MISAEQIHALIITARAWLPPLSSFQRHMNAPLTQKTFQMTIKRFITRGCKYVITTVRQKILVGSMKYYLVVTAAFDRIFFQVDSFFPMCINEKKDEVSCPRGTELEEDERGVGLMWPRSPTLHTHHADEPVLSEMPRVPLLAHVPAIGCMDFFCHLVVSLLSLYVSKKGTIPLGKLRENLTRFYYMNVTVLGASWNCSHGFTGGWICPNSPNCIHSIRTVSVY